MHSPSSQPIGIFDSGIGGLTVAKAVKDLLPNERIVYFGDLAHSPYGEKSTAAIQSYSVKITDVLLRHHCKVILIACNSASTAAFELIKEYTAKRAKVLDVIDPIVAFIGQNLKAHKIGLIGTKQTVKSNVYLRKIDALGANISLQSLATPLLVPLIEEGFSKHEVTRLMVNEYLSHGNLKDIQGLILGCTHYPVIKELIEEHYGPEFPVLDSASLTAQALERYLKANNLLNTSSAAPDQFLISDYTEAFEQATRIFFGTEVHLEKYPLWD